MEQTSGRFSRPHPLKQGCKHMCLSQILLPGIGSAGTLKYNMTGTGTKIQVGPFVQP